MKDPTTSSVRPPTPPRWRWASTRTRPPAAPRACNGTNAQRWTVGSDGTIRALGRCLDVSSASTANAAKVQLYTCNGTGAQRWTRSGTQLINANSGKCLDATGHSSADGTPLQQWTCTGASNQQWTLPS